MSLVQFNQIWIVIALFRLIWNQLEFGVVPKQSEKCNYNTKLV